MNFLAHLAVSHPDPDARVGNLLADFLKGPAAAALPPAVFVGVRQHRLVDGFTDRHPRVQRAITRISAKWGWFSGIILDVYFDHLLARDWGRYSAEPLRAFADRMYPVFCACKPYLHADDHWLADRFPADDRLAKYATRDGIRDALWRVSLRVAERIPKRALPLADAMPDLLEHDAGIADDFHAFFPALVAFARTCPGEPAGGSGRLIP